MKIGILVKDEKCELVEKFVKELEKFGIKSGFIGEKADNTVSLIVVFGGDGTILSSAPTAINSGVPIVTVNTGTVGFLSGYEVSDIEQLAKEIADNKLEFSTRTLIDIEFKGQKFTALNDAVIERDKAYKGHSVISKIALKIGGKSVYDLSSDGIIIASPTGSTAYSLSAGGVILTPDINSFIATPICSHSLSTRPIVYNDAEIVEVTLSDGADCILSSDGRPVAEIKQGETVKISKSEKTLKIAVGKYDFFGKIKHKLG